MHQCNNLLIYTCLHDSMLTCSVAVFQNPNLAGICCGKTPKNQMPAAKLVSCSAGLATVFENPKQNPHEAMCPTHTDLVQQA